MSAQHSCEIEFARFLQLDGRTSREVKSSLDNNGMVNEACASLCWLVQP